MTPGVQIFASLNQSSLDLSYHINIHRLSSGYLPVRKWLVLIDRPSDNFNRAFLEHDLEVFKPVRACGPWNAVSRVRCVSIPALRQAPPRPTQQLSTSRAESSFTRGSTACLASPQTPRNSSTQGPHTPDF